MDARRRIWIPLSVDFAHDDFGTKILGQFGHAGLLTWVAFIAACKRNPAVEGQFDFNSEAEGWALLGLAYPMMPQDFTLDEFFSFTGRLKKTRRTRTGRVSNVICRDWGKWQVRKPRDGESPENPSKEPQITDTKQRTSSADTDTIPRPTFTSTSTNTTTSDVREIFNHWIEARGKNPTLTRLTDKRRKIIKARLADFDVAALKRAIDGVANDPWEERRQQDDLTIIFRAENVEKFFALNDDVAALSVEERRKRHLEQLKAEGKIAS